MNLCHIFFIIKLAVVLVLIVLVPHAADAQSIRGSTSAYPYDIGGNVSPPVKIILAFLIFGMFLIAFLSLYLRKCLEDPSETRTNLVIVNNQRTRLMFPCGLDRLVVESFPVFLYSDVKHLKIGKGTLECAICISEFGDNERLRFLPKCHHVFHPDCIDAWLASHITCPVCRDDLTKTRLDHDPISIHDPSHDQTYDSRTEPESQNLDLEQVENEHAASKLPRAHTTGHLLVSPGENCERYTLRLPEEVRKHIVTLKRAKSCDCSVDGDSRRAEAGLRKWNPDRICGRSEFWNFTVARRSVSLAKTDSVGKSDMGQSSGSTSLPV
uniref:E3 ubiquitin-protein ligase ATL6-like n=1 Tax=Erigeron canadensis TaxID=72917 RepID=UPI001CB93443|nr:E3 ubiquitin-protein ligase ATL6-like [Erigeron canadensis]